ncbi:hypothetical protein F0Q45_07250 [Mycobacterium simiae]|uniref:Transposase n=1 Tax=Mycobacterium simiae TaxID=1784 RepID=A0A5B1BQ47_MYCSI|nr:hypothetical protein F0Q45_07250 [Mycobacterium simiae]
MLATRAGVPRSWIYTQPETRERIEHLQQTTPVAHSGAGVHRASDESLRRRLDLAYQRIGQLRHALARAHGQLRTAGTPTA